MSEDRIGVAHKSEFRVEKYDADGTKYEEIVAVQWFEADGTEVTDPERIAELERRANGG